jgi:hypothetical protein
MEVGGQVYALAAYPRGKAPGPNRWEDVWAPEAILDVVGGRKRKIPFKTKYR